MMNIIGAVAVGSIVIFPNGAFEIPKGWIDITGTSECLLEINAFRVEHPKIGELRDKEPITCIKKVK